MPVCNSTLCTGGGGQGVAVSGEAWEGRLRQEGNKWAHRWGRGQGVGAGAGVGVRDRG